MKRIALLLIMLLALNSCGTAPDQFQYEKIQGKRWPANQPIALTLESQDTTAPQDITLYLKHTIHYPNANLYLFIRTTAPDGTQHHDTLNYHLAEPSGQWRGKGFGEHREILLPYLYSTRFAQLGPYQFLITHGMRYDTLQGIQTIGIQTHPASKREP